MDARFARYRLAAEARRYEWIAALHGGASWARFFAAMYWAMAGDKADWKVWTHPDGDSFARCWIRR